jgi:parallel beta-helix repeat protein
VPNFELGIYAINSPGNTISNNLLSGNGIGGVELFGEQTTRTSIASNVIGGDANGAASFRGTSSTRTFVTPSGITVYYGLQEHGVIVIGASNNLIGSNGGNQIVGNIYTGVYLADRDFAGIIYAAPVNNKVQRNSIRTNGIYGVLRYNAPNNQVDTTGASRNVFSGDPVNINDFNSAQNSQSLPAPISTLLPPSSTAGAGIPGSTKHHKTPRGPVRSHPQKHGKAKHPAPPKRPRVPALFPKGAHLKLVTHKPSAPHVRLH